jgi:hypothetical protein
MMISHRDSATGDEFIDMILNPNSGGSNDDEAAE